MSRSFALLAVTIAGLFAASTSAAQAVRDSVRMTLRVFQYAYTTGDGAGHNCGGGIYATWPDIVEQVTGTPGTYNSYSRVATEGMYIPSGWGQTQTNPTNGITVPDDHFGHVAHWSWRSAPGNPNMEGCEGYANNARTLLEGGWTVLNASPYRITDWYAVYSVPNGRPIALYEWEQTAGLTVDFDGSFESRLSHEVDNTAPGGRRPVVSYAWDFGDGGTGSGARPTHAYADDGDYTVRLTVTDDDGQQSTYEQVVHVEPALLLVEVEAEPAEAAQDDSVTVVATVTNAGAEPVYDISARRAFSFAMRIPGVANESGSRRSSPTLTPTPLPAGEDVVVEVAELGPGESFEVRRTYVVTELASYRPAGASQYRPVDSEVEWDLYTVTGTQAGGEGVPVKRPCRGWEPDAGCEDVTDLVLASVVVNTTGDESDPTPTDGSCDVNAGEPGEQCTLRAALESANSGFSSGRIRFDFSEDDLRSGAATIALGAPLPTATVSVTLDATTAETRRAGGAPLVAVDGGDAVETGLVLTAGQSEVRGFAFVGFTGAALRIEGPGGNTVAGNFLGVDPDGATLRGNRYGVHVVGSRENTIGGTEEADRNVIGVPPSPAGTPVGDLAAGVFIDGDAADANTVAGNYIGVSASGTAMLADAGAPRSGIGVFVVAADSTVIGEANAANVIGGLQLGIAVTNATGEGQIAAALDTRIAGNRIGTTAAGADSLSNGSGVLLLGGALFTQVGGATAAEGNVISGNTVGIQLTDGGSTGLPGFPPVGTRIVGNTIGLAADGLTPLGNLVGIGVGGETLPGGEPSPGVRGVEIGSPGYPRNLIAGNRLIQVFVAGAGFPEYAGPDATPEQIALSYVYIRNSYLGLTAAGQPATTGDDRTPYGVLVAGGARAAIGAEGGRNVIGGHGVGLFLASERNLVYANYIGTDPSGQQARPNVYGAIVTGGTNLLGRPPADGQPYTGAYVLAHGNLVSGNDYSGLVLAPGIPPPADPTGELAARLAAAGLAPDGRLRRPVATDARGGDEGGPAILVGNRIGVSATGAALPNGAAFAADPQVPEVEVGGGVLAVRGDSYLLWNVIAGNVGDGLGVYSPGAAGSDEATLHLAGNSIGVSPDGAAGLDRPNTRDGVFNLGGDVRVGLVPDGGAFPAPGDGVRNAIWNNGRNGVTTAAFGRLFVTEGSFLGNGALGLDAGIAGPDGPGVPDGFLRPPALRVPTLTIAGADSTLVIPFRTPPATESGGTLQHRVEVYLSGACDGTGYGEGLVASFASAAPPDTESSVEIPLEDAGDQLRALAAAGAFLTATATQVLSPSGGLPPLYRTSEFSECLRFALPDDVAEAEVDEGETGTVLPGENGLGVTVTDNPPPVAPDARGAHRLADASGASVARSASGTLTAVRYVRAPQAAPVAGSATAPDGTVVAPNTVALGRYWLLRGDGLDGITYTACLNLDGIGGIANPAQLLVATRERPGLGWTPRSSTLDGGRLCAAGLTAFGELGVAADSLVNPVPDEAPPADAPAAFALDAYPNPARGAATLAVSVPAALDVSVAVYDLLGRRVAVLHEGPMAAGVHALAWDARGLAGGVYVVRATGAQGTRTRRLTVLP